MRIETMDVHRVERHAGHESATRARTGPAPGFARLRHFLRHLGEMVLAMMVGMAAAIPLLWAIFASMPANLQPSSGADAITRFPVLVSLVVAGAMIVPMVAWMRHRRHSWRVTSEMAVAMALPLVPIFTLLGLGVLAGAAACGLYCLSMVPAMVAAMLFRLDVYTSHAGHAG